MTTTVGELCPGRLVKLMHPGGETRVGEVGGVLWGLAWYQEGRPQVGTTSTHATTPHLRLVPEAWGGSWQPAVDIQIEGEGGWLPLWGHSEVSYVYCTGTPNYHGCSRTEDPWRRCESWHAAQRLAASYAALGAALTPCTGPISTDQSTGALALYPVSRRGSRIGPKDLRYIARSHGPRPDPTPQHS